MPKVLTCVLVVLLAPALYAQQATESELAQLANGYLPTIPVNLTSFDPPAHRLVTPELLSLTPPSYYGHPELGLRPFNTQCTDCVELVDRRTESTRYYIKQGTAGRTFYVQQSYGKLHYRDASGTLRTIDSRLRRHPDKPDVFYAPDQELPITVDLHRGYTSMILHNGFELKFNQNVTMWSKMPGKVAEFLKDDQSYTAGKNGVLNSDFWTNVDRHIVVDHGEIKTSYTMRLIPGALKGATEGFLAFDEWIGLPAGYELKRDDGHETPEGWWYGELSLVDNNGDEVARFGSPIVYDSKETHDPHPIVSGYNLRRTDNGVWIGVCVDLRWLNDQTRVLPIIIDPLVTGTNTYGAGSMGFQSDAACWNPANYCAYTMSVTVPGQSTLTNATFNAQYVSLANGCPSGAHCQMSAAAFRLYGPCTFSPGNPFYWTCTPPCNNPGTVTGNGLPMFPVVSCQPPQCPDHVLGFEMRLYHCSCSTGACATSCHYMPNNSWSITIEARTVESVASITGPPTICQGQSTTITGGGTYGVPGYSYQWNPGAINSQTTVVSPTTTTTYTLTVTDACSNTSTSMVTVTVRPVPILSLSSTQVSCFGGANGTATVSASGGTTFSYAWNSVPPQSTATASNLSAGTYTVTVTNNFGCQTVGSVTVTQPATAVAVGITGSTNVSCFGGTNGSATASASGGTPGYTYAWNTVPPQSTAAASSLAAGTYTVTATDSRGCVSTASVTITQPSEVTLVTTTTSPGCAGGNNGSASVSATGGTPGYTYVWSTTPPQFAPIASGLSAGTYSVTVTDANGCQKITTVTLTDPPGMSLTSSYTAALCATSANGTATVSASGGTPGYTYVWNTLPPQNTATAIGLVAGTYSVTVTDANGCQLITTVTVTAPPPLLLSLSKTDVNCNGGSDGTATVGPSGGTPGYTYAWNTVPTQTTPTATGLTAGSWSVTVTDANGCVSNGSVTVLQPPAIIVTVTGADPSCNGGNDGTATANLTNGAAPFTFAWSTVPIQTGVTATGLSAGTYSVTATDANGCQGVGSITLNQPTGLTASVTTTPALCNGTDDGTATVSTFGGTLPYTYLWNTTPAQTSPTAIDLFAGTWTVTVTDDNGCIIIVQGVVTEPPLISITLSTVAVSCSGVADGQATASATGGTAPYSFAWGTTPVQTTPTATGLAAGTYSVSITDSNGCMYIASVTIGEPPAMTLITSSVDETCTGVSNGSATVTAGGGVSPYSYSWNTTPPQSSPTAAALSAGTYAVTVTDDNGCTQVASVTIITLGGPTITLTPTDATCFGFSDGRVDIDVSSGATPYTFIWSNGSTTEDIAGVPAGSYSVTVIDDVGCIVTGSVIVGEPPEIILTLGADQSIQMGDSVVLISNIIPPGSYSYQWQPPTGLNDQFGSAPIAAPDVTTIYTLTITDANGCSASDDIRIDVVPPTNLTFPSAFTPDGDGRNDIFFDPSSMGLEILTLRIYNRWGDMIHGNNQPWDGTAYGAPQPMGTYVYDARVRFVGTQLELGYTGNVTLIR